MQKEEGRVYKKRDDKPSEILCLTIHKAMMEIPMNNEVKDLHSKQLEQTTEKQSVC